MNEDEKVVPYRVTVLNGRTLERSLYMAHPIRPWRRRLGLVLRAFVIALIVWALIVAFITYGSPA